MPFLEANMYTILIFGYSLGNFLSLTLLNELALTFPWLPPTLQAVNLTLIYFCTTCYLVTDMYVYFFWTMFVGMHTGTCYTSFCYLACTKFNAVNGMTFDM